MKLIKKLLFTLGLITLFVSCGEDESTITQVDENVVRGAILRTIEVDPLNFDLRDIERPWNLTVEMEDNKQGDLLDFVEIYVTFFDNTPENGENPVERQFVKIIEASDFVNGPIDLPRGNLTLDLPEVTAAAGLNEDQVEGGDVFRVELELNLTDGRVYTKDDVNGGVAGGSFFRSPYQYRLTIVGCAPRPGLYTIEMTDDFGDGWQSTTADDGPGIQVFGDGTLLGEFGICTAYNNSMEPWCTGSGSSASASFVMPEGVENATWIFPGDFWGEMGFEIFFGEGDDQILIYSAAPGTQSEGEFFVVLCNFND
jgi:hypothetical protein